ncbi:transporter [Roseivirga pacifica]|uniref:transporter n=1 Tax=Roseivirga pacifica TaxID=1267423 RepID=UPI00227A7816|nr:transporter [Roseivirga pacifica]
MKTLKLLVIALAMLATNNLAAQTPTDAILMGPKEICMAFTYQYGAWDQYWEGTRLRKNENVATLNQQMGAFMAAIGVHKKVNLLVGVPYVKTHSSEPNGGKMAGAQGFQDISFNVKAQVYERTFEKGALTVLANAGYSTPSTNYLSDYRPYSIGFGASEFNLRLIGQYKWNSGLFMRAATAHLWRGQTEAERDYYYANGSYYTALMDVPNAWEFNLVAGKWFLDNKLKVEASYVGIKSVNGDDIRIYNAGQPTNKVQFDQIGMNTQFFLPPIPWMSVLAFFSHNVNGRNAGKFTRFGIGTTIQFGF